MNREATIHSAERRRRRAATLLLALVLASGCGEQNRMETGFTSAADRIATAADDRSPGIAPVVPPLDRAPATVPGVLDTAAPPPPVSIELTSPAGALRGTARLRAAGGQTAIDATLAGGVPEESYAGMLRLGTCDAPGSGLTNLVEVTTDTTGTGRAHSFVPVPLDSLTGVGAVMVYGQGGRTETCGSIPSGRPPPAPAADTATQAYIGSALAVIRG